jgi:hypothetical protein
MLRSEPFALFVGRALQCALAIGCRLSRRPPPAGSPGPLLGFRNRAAALLKSRGWRITAATVAGNLALWLVLLACLRGTGLSQAQVPWQTSLAAFAAVRLLTALPVTPGGLGITELGLVTILAAGAGHKASVQVTAAVLLYRAVTYLPPIPLGALACLAWRHAPALIRISPHNPHDVEGVFPSPGSLRFSGDPAVGVHLGRHGTRSVALWPPFRGDNHSGRHQFQAGERQPGELAGITRLKWTPASRKARTAPSVAAGAYSVVPWDAVR